MSYFKPFSLTAIVCTALLLNACQTKEPLPPTSAELVVFAHNVQDAAVEDLTVLASCSALGGPVADQASAVRESWQFTNTELLSRSEALILADQPDVVNWDERLYSLSSVFKVRDLGDRVSDRLNLSQRGPDAQKAVCRRELDRVESARYTELDANAALSQTLLSDYPPLADNIVGVSDIRDRFNRWPEPGRSFFSVSQSLQANCSGNSRIITLLNQWPLESYAHYCNQAPAALVSCEWGECRQQEPTAPDRESE